MESILIEYEGRCTFKAQSKEVKKMRAPARCMHCRKIFDLAKVKTIGRYADCTVFRTPCCNVQADDRTWVSSPDIQKL